MRFQQSSVVRWLIAAMLLTGCGPNWQAVTPPHVRAFDNRTVFEFHANDHLVRLHGVRITPDSISGIPWLEHLSCDTCRVGYALSDVTELRTGKPGAGAWNIVLPVVGILALLRALYGLIPET